jgi:hypothetical protein
LVPVLFSVAPTRVAENTAATGSAAATAILGARVDAQTDGPISTGKRDGAVGAEAEAAPNVKDNSTRVPSRRLLPTRPHD